MNRRELLKPLAALTLAPLVVKGREVGKSIAIAPQAKYVVFVDDEMIDGEAFAHAPSALPPGTIIYPVRVPRDKTLDDAIRIFEVK